MKRFKVLKQDYRNIGRSTKQHGCTYKFLYTVQEFTQYEDEFRTLIDEFNSEYKWEEMFTYEDALLRMQTGHHANILFYGDRPTGYCWFKEGWSFNLYVSKVWKRPSILSLLYVNDMTQDTVDKFGYLEYETDDWNSFMLKWANMGNFSEV